MFSDENPVDLYRRIRSERHPGDRANWILLIKELRVTHGCGIFEAEQMALRQPTWRRWVERQINRDPQCSRMARRHIRSHGEAALLAEVEGRLVVL